MNPQDPQQQQYGQPAYTPPSLPPMGPQGQFASTPPPAAPTSPAPNPSNAAPHNPYEFILNPEKKHHAAPASDSVMKRVLIIVGFLVVLAIIAAVAVKLLAPKDTSTQQIATIAQDQQEIVRVATYVASHAKSTELVNFAVNTELSVGTNQKAAIDYATTRGVKLDDKTLALKTDATTDKTFSSALSSNTFDATAAQTLNTQLSTYQLNLKKAYAASSGKKARAILQASYDASVLLAAQGASLK